MTLENKFDCIDIIMDVYTGFGVKASAWKNPIRSVGAGVITGIDDPKILETQRLRYSRQLSMTPQGLVNELHGFEKLFSAQCLREGQRTKYTGYIPTIRKRR